MSSDCTAECAGHLRRLAVEQDDPVDMEVKRVGPHGIDQRHRSFLPMVATCPHGTRWQVQPTDWQIRDWELRRVP